MIPIPDILKRLAANYRLDVRAIALMRIAVALVVIFDLCFRMCSLEAHYTETGVWPAKYVFTFLGKPWAWSFHCLFDTYAWELSLFILHLAVAGLVLIGYKTRFSTFILYLFTLSLHNRNVYVLQAGDDLLRLCLFWGLFLNWGNAYSIDAGKKGTIREVSFIGQLGYLGLIASVYLFTVLLKSGNEWRIEGSAIYYALSLEQLRLPFVGDWLYSQPSLMVVLTRLVYGAECLIPVLILWPTHKKTTYTLAFLLILLLHLGIALTLYVGLFFIISIVTAIGFLPPRVFDRLEHSIPWLRPRLLLESSDHGIIRILSLLAGSLAFFFSLMNNLKGLPYFPYELNPVFARMANASGLEQYWGMFSPDILKKDAWPVLYGIDNQHRQWDLRTNRDYVDFKKPKRILDLYSSDRWRKFSENLQSEYYTFLRAPYCKFMLHRWNTLHPEKQIVNLNLYFVSKMNLPDYKTSPLKKELYCVCDEH